MIKISKVIKYIKDNKLLTIALIATVPTLFLWFSATLSYLYFSYIGPFIFKLSKTGEIVIFLLLPTIGLITSFVSFRKKSNKLTKVLLFSNIILLAFVLLFSFLFT